MGKQRMSLSSVLRRALRHVEGEIRWHEPLAPHTSLQVGGPADVLVIPADVEDVIRVSYEAHGCIIFHLMVLGGTNVVIRDKGDSRDCYAVESN